MPSLTAHSPPLSSLDLELPDQKSSKSSSFRDPPVSAYLDLRSHVPTNTPGFFLIEGIEIFKWGQNLDHVCAPGPLPD